MKIIKASAGSGKTYRLSHTYIDYLLSSDDPFAYRHLLAVTFTNKATAEMKEGRECDLLARLAAEKQFGLSREEMEAVLDPKLYTGRCAEQVTRFVAKVRPLLEGIRETTAEINL